MYQAAAIGGCCETHSKYSVRKKPSGYTNANIDVAIFNIAKVISLHNIRNIASCRRKMVSHCDPLFKSHCCAVRGVICPHSVMWTGTERRPVGTRLLTDLPVKSARSIRA